MQELGHMDYEAKLGGKAFSILTVNPNSIFLFVEAENLGVIFDAFYPLIAHFQLSLLFSHRHINILRIQNY